MSLVLVGIISKKSTNVKSKLWVLRRNRLVQTLNLAPYMDARIVTDNIDPKTLTLPTDPHPSALKHRLLGEILTEAFLPLVS